MKKSFLIPALFLLTSLCQLQAKEKLFTLQSPDRSALLEVFVGKSISWNFKVDGRELIVPSTVSLRLSDGTIIGQNEKVVESGVSDVSEKFSAINYRKEVVQDNYSLLRLSFKSGFGMEFRLYDDAVAYRFTGTRDETLVISGEEANFNFPGDHKAFIPYLWDYRGGALYNASFESMYTRQPISEFATDSLAILPLLVDAGNGMKMVILEADLESYPGMFLTLNDTKTGFMGHFAPYPLEWEEGGYNHLNLIPT